MQKLRFNISGLIIFIFVFLLMMSFMTLVFSLIKNEGEGLYWTSGGSMSPPGLVEMLDTSVVYD